MGHACSVQPDGSEELVTSRLRLEPLREEHAAEMVSVLSHAELYEFTGGFAPSLADLARRYRLQVSGPGGSDEVWRNWILRESEGSRAAGFVQATIVAGEADVAWLVGHDFQGQGYGAEAATALCEWLTSTGVQRLTAHIHPGHTASQRIAAAVGLNRTGAVDEDGEEIWASSP